MKKDRQPLTRDELGSLHRRATATVTGGRGSITWAADTLGVTRQTVHRWLAGTTQPTPRQLARLRIAAGASEIRRDREASRGIWGRFLALFGAGFNDRVTAAAVERERERLAAQTRANQAFQRRDVPWIELRSRTTMHAPVTLESWQPPRRTRDRGTRRR